MLNEKTVFNATTIVAGINKTSRLLRISFNIDRIGLRLEIKISVLFPCPPTITRETLARRNVMVFLSVVCKNPTANPKRTSST